MSNYSTPQVTIDLKEYTDLQDLQKRIEDNPYKKAWETYLARLSSEMGRDRSLVYPHIGESFKINGVQAHFDGVQWKIL